VRRFGISAMVLLCLAGAHVLLLNQVEQLQRQLPVSDAPVEVLPGSVLGLVFGEHKGLAADLFFIRGLVAFGKVLESGDGKALNERDWRSAYHLIETSSKLDPYFFDPYYLVNAVLGRNPASIGQVNALLKEGVEKRTWDWVLPFYIGFNYFYYLQEPARAADYLMLGAQRPDAMPLLATLAARLAYQGNRTQNAIIFLRGIISNTEDEKTRELYRTRMEALEQIYLLEQAVAFYESEFGCIPETVQTLLSAGIIDRIPMDPYGGDFYLTEEGLVKSTSELGYVNDPK